MNAFTAIALTSLSPAIGRLLARPDIQKMANELGNALMGAAKEEGLQPSLATIMALTYNAAAGAAAMSTPEGRAAVADLMHHIIDHIMSMDVEALMAEQQKPEVVH